MAIKKIGLAWVSVSDFKRAEKFYVETLGLKLQAKDEKWNWLELSGPEGECRLGVGQEMEDAKAGMNAVVTFTVDDIEAQRKDLMNKGVDVSEIMEVPGHVKLASFADPDGNQYQLAQPLDEI